MKQTCSVAILVLLASLMQGLAEPQGSSRVRIDVAGEWRYLAVPETNMTALPPDTATNWTTVVVPNMWKPGVSNGVWLTRAFRLPENLAGRRIFLRALGAYVGTRVFVNGRDCGHYLGGYAPWEADISAACRPGENTLYLAMTSQEAEKPRYEFYDPAISYDPHGRQTIGILEDIAVEIVPEVFVNDIFAVPAVTNRQLTAVVEIVNAGAVTRTVEVSAAVQELDGKEVKRLPSTRVSVAPGARTINGGLRRTRSLARKKDRGPGSAPSFRNGPWALFRNFWPTWMCASNPYRHAGPFPANPWPGSTRSACGTSTTWSHRWSATTGRPATICPPATNRSIMFPGSSARPLRWTPRAVFWHPETI